MRLSTRILMAAACALVAGAVVAVYLRAARPPRATRTVLVAARPVARGTRLERDMIREESFPPGLVPGNACAALDDTVGQTAAVDLAAGEPLLTTKLVSGRGGVASLVPPGMRAVTLPLPRHLQESGGLAAGERVDVVAILQGRGRTRGRARTIVQGAAHPQTRKRAIRTFRGAHPQTRKRPGLPDVRVISPNRSISTSS